MPFIAGVLLSCLPAVQKMMDLMSEVYVFDFDTNQYIVSPPNLEIDTLPQPHSSHLLHKLEKLSRESNKKHRSPEKKKTFNKRVREAFLVFWVDVIGSYRKFLPPDGSRFNSQLFVTSQTPETNQFLENLTRVQMFEVFIRERERLKESIYFQGPFEERVSMIERFEEALSRVSGKEAKSLHDALSNLKGGSRKQLKAEIKGMKAKTKAKGSEVHLQEEEMDEPKMQVTFRSQETQKVVHHQNSEIVVGSHRLDLRSKVKVDPSKANKVIDLACSQDTEISFSCPELIIPTSESPDSRWINAAVPLDSKRPISITRFTSVSANDFIPPPRKLRRPERLSLSILHHNLVRKKPSPLNLHEELGHPPVRDPALFPSLVSPREKPTEVRESKRSNSVGSLADLSQWYSELPQDLSKSDIKIRPPIIQSPVRPVRSTTGESKKVKHMTKPDSEQDVSPAASSSSSNRVKLVRGMSSPLHFEVSKNPASIPGYISPPSRPRNQILKREGSTPVKINHRIQVTPTGQSVDPNLAVQQPQSLLDMTTQTTSTSPPNFETPTATISESTALLATSVPHSPSISATTSTTTSGSPPGLGFALTSTPPLLIGSESPEPVSLMEPFLPTQTGSPAQSTPINLTSTSPPTENFITHQALSSSPLGFSPTSQSSPPIASHSLSNSTSSVPHMKLMREQRFYGQKRQLLIEKPESRNNKFDTTQERLESREKQILQLEKEIKRTSQMIEGLDETIVLKADPGSSQSVQILETPPSPSNLVTSPQEKTEARPTSNDPQSTPETARQQETTSNQTEALPINPSGETSDLNQEPSSEIKSPQILQHIPNNVNQIQDTTVGSPPSNLSLLSGLPQLNPTNMSFESLYQHLLFLQERLNQTEQEKVKLKEKLQSFGYRESFGEVSPLCPASIQLHESAKSHLPEIPPISSDQPETPSLHLPETSPQEILSVETQTSNQDIEPRIMEDQDSVQNQPTKEILDISQISSSSPSNEPQNSVPLSLPQSPDHTTTTQEIISSESLAQTNTLVESDLFLAQIQAELDSALANLDISPPPVHRESDSDMLSLSDALRLSEAEEEKIPRKLDPLLEKRKDTSKSPSRMTSASLYHEKGDIGHSKPKRLEKSKSQLYISRNEPVDKDKGKQSTTDDGYTSDHQSQSQRIQRINKPLKKALLKETSPRQMKGSGIRASLNLSSSFIGRKQDELPAEEEAQTQSPRGSKTRGRGLKWSYFGKTTTQETSPGADRGSQDGSKIRALLPLHKPTTSSGPSPPPLRSASPSGSMGSSPLGSPVSSPPDSRRESFEGGFDKHSPQKEVAMKSEAKERRKKET